MAADLKKRIELLQMGEAQGRLKPEHMQELGRYREQGLAGATKGEIMAGKREAASTKQFDDASGVISDVQNARDLLGQTKLGSIGRFVGQAIPGAPAYDLDKALDGVRANVGFAKLAEMQAASPTDAALGSVTEKENVLLQSVLGSLNVAQSEEQLQRSLNKVDYHQRRLRMIAEGKTPRPYNAAEAEGRAARAVAPKPAAAKVGGAVRFEDLP